MSNSCFMMRSVNSHPTAPVRVVLSGPDGWSVHGEGMVPRAGVTQGVSGRLAWVTRGTQPADVSRFPPRHVRWELAGGHGGADFPSRGKCTSQSVPEAEAGCSESPRGPGPHEPLLVSPQSVGIQRSCDHTNTTRLETRRAPECDPKPRAPVLP